MSNELVISSSAEGDRIALIQDRKLVEYHLESKTQQFTVGDIYLGVVRKLNPSLNAAFIDVGYEKDAFLHYLDLGSRVMTLNNFVRDVTNGTPSDGLLNKVKLAPEIDKAGKMSDVLTKGQHILVQIVKEPISTKGPRLSCELSLAGRYLVLVPFSNTVSISKKIVAKEERQRLSRAINAIRPQNFGVIIRTVAEGHEVEDLQRDLQQLITKWQQGILNLKNAKVADKIIGEMSRSNSILRDLLNDSFESITTDSKDTFEEVRRFVSGISPDKEKIVKLHNGKVKLFEAAGVERQLKTLFGKSVTLPGGGYLIIEHTEALHVIDVNSGGAIGKDSEKNHEEGALAVNKLAANEIARQLRLRDMGGIIVIDFIDMRDPENRKILFDTMRDAMALDRAKHTILPLSKFGLMQITRQRVRPEMNVATSEACPTCGGSGKIQASISVTDNIEAYVEYLLTKQNESKLLVHLHPFTEAYFKVGFPNRQWQWFFKYKRWVSIVKDSSLGLTDFIFFNQNGEKIELN